MADALVLGTSVNTCGFKSHIPHQSINKYIFIGENIMTIQDKIIAIDNRINLLRERGETMNMRIINKLIRKKRALEKTI